MTDLPKIKIHIKNLQNPDWKPSWVKDSFGNNHPSNVSNMDDYYLSADVEAEVLTVHFNKGTMRVRFKWNNTVDTRDIPNDEFFKHYKIIEI